MKANTRQLETKLSGPQVKAAQLLALNKYLPTGKNLDEETLQAAKEAGEARLTLEEVADRAGVTVRQLYNWRNSNEDFIAYVNAVSANAFMSHLPDIFEKHLEMTLKGQGSMKGIELFYKFGGLLIDKQEQTIETTGKTDEDMRERLARIQERLENMPTKEGE